MNYGYSYPYQQPYQSQTYGNQSTTTNGIIWVQGIEGAKAYQLVPNSNVLLMDSENDGIFYIKVSDNVGMCSLRTFKYEEIISNQTAQVDLSEYVKKTELEALINSMLGGSKNEQSVSTAKSTIA